MIFLRMLQQYFIVKNSLYIIYWGKLVDGHIAKFSLSIIQRDCSFKSVSIEMEDKKSIKQKCWRTAGRRTERGCTVRFCGRLD